ncbi:DUF3005 domain-containing protein, partial [Burkholderia pseudomallei]|uniref:DUF3005 domain-containing protein n=1 Tax=Burkholderia pseudomallei TaxID=28450 RepID=UPI000CCDE3F4
MDVAVGRGVVVQLDAARPRSIELYNNPTPDSNVHTDGKNAENSRLTSDGPISTDSTTTKNTRLSDALQHTPSRYPCFDNLSRGPVHRVLRPGCAVLASTACMASPPAH